MKDLQFLNYLNEKIEQQEGMALISRRSGQDEDADTNDNIRTELIKVRASFLNIYKS